MGRAAIAAPYHGRRVGMRVAAGHMGARRAGTGRAISPGAIWHHMHYRILQGFPAKFRETFVGSNPIRARDSERLGPAVAQ